jgi:hypothetical protein
MWWRDRHIFHGRLLAAGHKEGINNFDLFDAACFALGEMFRLAEATGFTYDSERVKKLRDAVKLGQTRPDDALAEVQRMRAEMEGTIDPAAQNAAGGPTATSRTGRIDRTMQDLMEMRAEMEGRGDSTGS